MKLLICIIFLLLFSIYLLLMLSKYICLAITVFHVAKTKKMKAQSLFNIDLLLIILLPILSIFLDQNVFIFNFINVLGILILSQFFYYLIWTVTGLLLKKKNLN